ncbi:o-spanin [Xanthomonas phage Pagan]|uniref:O-spanin n=1 Tax=Xanthomonas phage Pagan TaxID=2591104 RepID=A0A5B9NE07_9CAUD|nr:o-spanin [Xanthomonas phage Pagan]
MFALKKFLTLPRSTGMALFLLMSLTSCANLPVPDDSLLADCHITYLGGEKGTASSQDKVVKLAQDRRLDTVLCNKDKAALRAWKAEVCGTGKRRCTGDK